MSPSAAAAAVALHRQGEDGGTINLARIAADEAIGQHQRLDMIGGQLVGRTDRDRKDCGEPEQPTAIRVMRVAFCACAGVLVLIRGMRNTVIVRVMMNRSVTVDVNIGVGSGNLGYVIKAVGGDGAVRECQSNRRQDAAHEIK